MKIKKSTTLSILICVFKWFSEMSLMLAPIMLIVFDSWKISVVLVVMFFILQKIIGWLEIKWVLS